MPRTKTIRELRRELTAKEAVLTKIQAQRGKLLAKLDVIDRTIALLTGGKAGPGRPAKVGRPGKVGRPRKNAAPVRVGRRRRGRNEKSLVQTIHEVLSAQPKGLRVKDIAQAVLDAGYKTGSDKFYGLVAAAVRDLKLFKKVSRGVYRAA